MTDLDEQLVKLRGSLSDGEFRKASDVFGTFEQLSIFAPGQGSEAYEARFGRHISNSSDAVTSPLTHGTYIVGVDGDRVVVMASDLAFLLGESGDVLPGDAVIARCGGQLRLVELPATCEPKAVN